MSETLLLVVHYLIFVFEIDIRDERKTGNDLKSFFLVQCYLNNLENI